MRLKVCITGQKSPEALMDPQSCDADVVVMEVWVSSEQTLKNLKQDVESGVKKRHQHNKLITYLTIQLYCYVVILSFVIVYLGDVPEVEEVVYLSWSGKKMS